MSVPLFFMEVVTCVTSDNLYKTTNHSVSFTKGKTPITRHLYNIFLY